MKKLIILNLLFLFSCSFIKEVEIDSAIKRGKNYYHEGNYREALRTCYNYLDNYQENKEFKNFCFSVFMNIKEEAEQLYRQEAYKKAGLTYKFLIEYKPKSLKIEIEELQAMKTECIKRLSARALSNYRKGNIKDAISMWNDVLDIDPMNSEAKKSISTASTQLKNINEMQ